jgi:uncharacterized protein YdhG (YjbR/CyaY superfamily)
MNAKFNTIECYIENFQEPVKEILNQIRKVIKESVPEAAETISYQIPTFKLGGKALVHFAGFKNHIGLYATPQGHEEFAKELSNYKQGKGSVQFPIDKPIPFDLIRRMVLFRKNSLSRPASNQ